MQTKNKKCGGLFFICKFREEFQDVQKQLDESKLENARLIKKNNELESDNKNLEKLNYKLNSEKQRLEAESIKRVKQLRYEFFSHVETIHFICMIFACFHVNALEKFKTVLLAGEKGRSQMSIDENNVLGYECSW